MLNCKRVSQLTSEHIDRDASWVERIGIAIHRIICAPCRSYYKQMKLLRAKVEKLDTQVERSLDTQARDRIRARMQDAKAKPPSTDYE